MTEFLEPRSEIEWSRRAIINVVHVLSAHAESLTLVGAHAVLVRTMELDLPTMPTGDGDLGVTPAGRRSIGRLSPWLTSRIPGCPPRSTSPRSRR
jgi:hypothetical protein